MVMTTQHTELVLGLVRKEREAQEARYGATNGSLVSGTGPETRWLLPYTTQRRSSRAPG
jgi:hypothetical protein